MHRESPGDATDTDRPDEAQAVAMMLWLRAARDAVPAGDVDATVELLLRMVEAGLRRWLGAEGYAALLARAATETLRSRPALAAARDIVPAPPPRTLDARFSGDETRDAILALLVTMTRHLGAIIGEDMALRLVALCPTPSTRGPAGAETNTTSP